MAGIGILIGLAVGAIGLAVGVVAAWVGIIVGLMGCVLGLSFHLFPVVLIGVGIVWLVRRSDPAHVPAETPGRAGRAPTQSPPGPQ